MPPKTKKVKTLKDLKQEKKTLNQLVKKEVEKINQPSTITATGAMKPKIMSTFVKPVRMQKLSFEGSWNAVCNSPNASVPYVFNMNSIKDPDFSNFTKNTTANGWEIAKTLYNAYRVHKCKVKITFFNNSEQPVYVMLSANNNIGIQPTSSLPSDILARPGSFGKICGRYASDNDTVSITKTYKLYEVEGISQSEYNDSAGSSALMTTNPTDLCYCYASIATLPEGFLNNGFGVFNIKMVFDVELLNVKEPVATQP